MLRADVRATPEQICGRQNEETSLMRPTHEKLPYAPSPHATQTHECSTYRGESPSEVVAEMTTVIVSAAVSHVLFSCPTEYSKTISDEGTSCFAGEHERQGEARQTV